jgi:hypothetical protein
MLLVRHFRLTHFTLPRTGHFSANQMYRIYHVYIIRLLYIEAEPTLLLEEEFFVESRHF